MLLVSLPFMLKCAETQVSQYEQVDKQASGVYSIVEQWRVGSRDGLQGPTFGNITNVATGPHGRIFVIDFQAQQIAVFDSRGGEVRRVGQAGEGPGEFDGPIALSIDNEGHLWVVDGWNRRYSVFDSAGVLLRTLPRRIKPAGFRETFTQLRSGVFLDETSWSGAGGNAMLAFVAIDDNGEVIDTVQRLGLQRSPGLKRLIPFPAELRPFVPRLVAAATPDGSVWFARTDEPYVRLQNRAGETVRVVKLQHANLELTRAEARLIDVALHRANAPSGTSDYGRQMIQDIALLDDGHLIVLIEEETGRDSNLLEVFTPEGVFAGSLRAPFRIDQRVRPAFRGDTMIAVTRDELDVQYLVRATLHRPDVGSTASF